MKWLLYNPPSRHPEFGLLHLVRLRAKSVGLSSLLSVAGSPIVDTPLIKRQIDSFRPKEFFDPTVTFQNKIQIGCSLVLYPMRLLKRHLLMILKESSGLSNLSKIEVSLLFRN